MNKENTPKRRNSLIFIAVAAFLMIGAGITFVGGGNNVTKLLSQFSGANTTPANAATQWQPTPSNTYRATVGATNATRLDGVIRGILSRGAALNVDQFKTFLTNVDTGIKTLAAKPAYVADQNVQNIVGYIAFELNDAKTNITSGADFVTEMVGVIDGISTGGSSTGTGTVVAPDDLTNFINAAYQSVLQRTSDAAGLTYWKSQITNGTVARTNLNLTLACASLGTDGPKAQAWLQSNGKSCTTTVTTTVCSGSLPTTVGIVSKPYNPNEAVVGPSVPNAVWKYSSTLTSCTWSCSSGYAQDGNNGCKAVTSTPVVTECTGTAPTAGPGLLSVGYNTSGVVAGPATIGTSWMYSGDTQQSGCTWSCKDGYARDGNACKAMAPGSGVTINVIDQATGAPLAGVNVSVIHSYCSSTSTLGSYMTDAAGKTSEFYLPSHALCGFVFQFEKAGYVIKSGTNCISRVTGGNNYCDHGVSYIGRNSVSVTLSNGTGGGGGTSTGTTTTPGITSGEFASSCGAPNVPTQWYCGGTPSGTGWSDVGGGCFHRCKPTVTSTAPTPAPTPGITSGEFASSCGAPNVPTQWYCGGTPSGTGWSDVGGGCFHRCKQ